MITLHIEALLTESEWSWSDALQMFEQELDSISHIARQEAIQKLQILIEKQILNQVAEPVVLLLNDAPVDLWAQIAALVTETKTDTIATLKTRLSSLQVSETEASVLVAASESQIWTQCLNVLKKETSDTLLVEKLKKRFDRVFR